MSKPTFFVYMSIAILFACGETVTEGVPQTNGQAPSPTTGTPLSQDGKLALPSCEQLTSGEQSACETTIYALKDPNVIPEDSRVSIQGVVGVTRLNADGKYSHLVLQLTPDDPAYSGDTFHAAWIYLNNTDIETLRDDPPAVGTYIQVIGSVKTHYGQRQLQRVEQVVELSQGQAPLIPIEVNSADIATNGALSWALEGALVKIRNAQVTNASPPAGPGDGIDGAPTYEFEVDGGLIVNDFLFPGLPQPSNGTQYSEIVGHLRYANDAFKLEPRSAADIF